MGKGYLDLTPEQRAAMAERQRLLKLFGEKHGLKDAEKRVRQIGQNLGLNLIAEKLAAEKLREAEAAPATPQKPTPAQRKRGRVGRKRSIPQEQIDSGILILQSKGKMTVEAARETLRAAGIEGSDSALYRHIIEPSGISK
jgi:hypothetical protein